MDNCIFCKIAAGQMPCYKVYEDDLFLGFLDINPQVYGHTLLIPKKHHKWTYDVPEFDKYWLAVLKITNVYKKVFNTDFVSYGTHGLDIFHAHIHIFPHENGQENRGRKIDNSKESLEALVKKIQISSNSLG